MSQEEHDGHLDAEGHTRTREDQMKAIASLATVLLMLAGVGLVACGDDDDGDTEVSMTEYAFEPKDLTVSKGDTIIAKNDGQIDHNYSILGGASRRCRALPGPWRIARCREGARPEDGDDVAPGTDGALTVNIGRGTYDVICTIPGHAEKGMKGTLTVE
jgi:plastocyanin